MDSRFGARLIRWWFGLAVTLGIVATLVFFIGPRILRAQAQAAPRQPGAVPQQSNALDTLSFPRLSLWWPDTVNQPAGQLARYDYIVFRSDDRQRVPAIKALHPGLIALTSTNASEVHFSPTNPDAVDNAVVRTIPLQWFLTQVGTTLAQNVDATTTVLPVAALQATNGTQTVNLFVPGDTALLDGESVYIDAVNAATSTLTVRRGYVRPAGPHLAGTRIAPHVSFWPNSWVLNLSTLSPTAVVDPAIGPERWAGYSARLGAALLADPLWDGLLIDRSDGNQSWLIGHSTIRSLDPDQSNRLLADYSGFDAAWNAGLRQYETLLRSRVGPQRILMVNVGMPNFDLLNGSNFETFPMSDGTAYGTPWKPTVFGPLASGSYFDWLAHAQQPNLTMIQTYQDDDGADPLGSGTYDNPCVKPGFVPNYRKMRFGLTTALLNNGFFSYEMNTNGHGALCLMWFDEYDNAGKGRGYLGQPLGPAQALPMGDGGVWRRDYAGGIVLVNGTAAPQAVPLGGTFRKIKGTQAPDVNDGSLVSAVTLPALDGVILLRDQPSQAYSPPLRK